LSSHRPRPRRTPNRRPAAPAVRTRAPGLTAARRPTPALPDKPSGIGASLGRASTAVLLWLSRAPRWLVGLVAAAVLLGGLIAPLPWGPLLLSLVAVFLGWLLILAWPALDPGGKAIRAAALALVIVAAVGRALGTL
jgi:hypothetical protein